MVRWPVGSDLALSGPLLTKINLDDGLDAAAWDEPADGTLKAYSSSFEAVANVERGKPLPKFNRITMTSAADHFEPLLNIAPSSRHKIQAANGTLEAKLTTHSRFPYGPGCTRSLRTTASSTNRARASQDLDWLWMCTMRIAKSSPCTLYSQAQAPYPGGTL